MLSGAEIAGNPRLLGTLAREAPTEVQSAFYAALQNLSADGIGVVREGSTITMLDAKMQGVGGIWETILKMEAADMSKAVLGSTLNVEVGDSGGNRSLGESQKDVTIAPRWHMSARLVGGTIARQLLAPFLRLNRHMWDGHVFVPMMNLLISEDVPVISDIAVQSGVVKRDELRRSCNLEPLGAEAGGDELIPALTSTADANIYKAQVAVDPNAVPPNNAPPVSAQGGAAPRPFSRLSASRNTRLTTLATRLR